MFRVIIKNFNVIGIALKIMGTRVVFVIVSLCACNGACNSAVLYRCRI